jgi:hypothetical protein
MKVNRQMVYRKKYCQFKNRALGKRCQLWTGLSKFRAFLSRHGMALIQTIQVDLEHAIFVTPKEFSLSRSSSLMKKSDLKGLNELFSYLQTLKTIIFH